MAAIRAACLFLAIVGFFLLGAPAQWVIARRAPGVSDRIPVFFCRTLLRLIGLRVSIEGTRVAAGPVLTVANHVSWIDILALGAVTPFCFLAKREVASWPILSTFAEVQGTVFVDRKRRRSIPATNRAMAARMLAGRPVLLFPEGTTIGAAEPGRFFSSHFAAARDLLQMDGRRSEVAVQPVAIAYSSAEAAWIGDEALLPHLWRILRAPPLRCVLRFAAPVAVSAGSDRKGVARQCREAVAVALRQPLATAAKRPLPALAPATTSA